jgi:hypothetical protein
VCAVQGAVGATTVGGTLTAAAGDRHPLHGYRRSRRRPPWLSDSARRLGRPRRCGADPRR